MSFAWELAAELPANLQNQILHGRNFSESLHGAQLLYNLILAEQRGWQEKTDSYRKNLADWWEKVSERMAELRSWDHLEFWGIVRQSNPRVSPRARTFIEAWIELTTSVPDLASIMDAQSVRGLVGHREIQLKGKLARVRSERATELWNGAAGAAQLDLRWGSARRIVADIIAGLEAETDA